MGRGEGWARPSGRPVPDVFLSFRISLQGQEGQEPASWIWVEWAKFGLQSYKRAGSECSPTLRGVAGAGGGVHRGRGPESVLSVVGPLFLSSVLQPAHPSLLAAPEHGHHAPASGARTGSPLPGTPPPTQRPLSASHPALKPSSNVSPRGLCPSMAIAIPISIPLTLIYAFSFP